MSLQRLDQPEHLGPLGGDGGGVGKALAEVEVAAQVAVLVGPEVGQLMYQLGTVLEQDGSCG